MWKIKIKTTNEKIGKPIWPFRVFNEILTAAIMKSTGKKGLFIMQHTRMKEKLLGMFDSRKLQAAPWEWGFYNELERDIKCVGYAANLTEDVIGKADTAGVDLLLTHHDSWGFLYGLKETCNRLLKKYQITHVFFHAPLSDAEFGTSSTLAAALGLDSCYKVMPYAGVYMGGVIGERKPVAFETFTEELTGILNEPLRCFKNNERPVRKIAVAPGAGNMTAEMKIAYEAGCDTYITGEYGMYTQQYAQFTGMNLMVGSHTGTEIMGVGAMAGKLVADTELELIRMDEPGY